MRRIAVAPPECRQKTSLTRFMLVTNPQSREVNPGCVVVYLYMIEDADGPSFTVRTFETAELALTHYKEAFGIDASEWKAIPDQVPGCHDDWIAPVRTKRNANGEYLNGQWEKRTFDGAWRDVQGPAGGYGVQVQAPIAGLPSMSTLDKAAAEFFARVQQSQGPVLIYFFTTWCEISQKYELIVDEIERARAGIVEVWRIDSDAYFHAKVELKANATPYLILFVNGKERGRPQAYWNAALVLAEIDKLLEHRSA